MAYQSAPLLHNLNNQHGSIKEYDSFKTIKYEDILQVGVSSYCLIKHVTSGVQLGRADVFCDAKCLSL